jgi:uncharacterized protein (TIGR02246 family)
MNNQSPDDAIRALYHGLLDAWNRRSARDMAALFAGQGGLVGFDGSEVNGRADIEAHLTAIFTDHVTARYVGKVREVRFLSPEVAVLRAVVGMVPPGGTDINPAVNAVQTLVAARHEGEWRVEMYQNTPAAFHGRPDLSAALTEELRALL